LPDLVVPDESGTVGVLLNTGGGSFAPMSSFPVGAAPYGVAIGDLNGDGKPDMAVSAQDGTVKVLLNAGGSFALAGSFGVGTSPRVPVIADFDGDGLPDIAVPDSTSSTVSVLLQRGCPPCGGASPDEC